MGNGQSPENLRQENSDAKIHDLNGGKLSLKAKYESKDGKALENGNTQDIYSSIEKLELAVKAAKDADGRMVEADKRYPNCKQHQN